MNLLDDPSHATAPETTLPTQDPSSHTTCKLTSQSPSSLVHPHLLPPAREYDQVSSISNPITTPSCLSSRSCSRNTTIATGSSRPSSSLSGSYVTNYFSHRPAARRANHVPNTSTSTNHPRPPHFSPSPSSQCNGRHSHGARSLTPRAKTPSCSPSSTPRSTINPISKINSPSPSRYHCDRRRRSDSLQAIPDNRSASNCQDLLHRRNEAWEGNTNDESVKCSDRDSFLQKSSSASGRSNSRGGRHGSTSVCPNLRLTGCHCYSTSRGAPSLPVSPGGKDLRFATHVNNANYHHIQPYARSRESDPEGFLFTCYLDYSRCVKPPPVCSDSCSVRPESLQYSNTTSCNTISSAGTCYTDTPRSSSSHSSTANSSIVTGGSSRRQLLYSRPPTPTPFSRSKDVHRLTMAGVPVDVKELTTCYLFVVEIPGLKNTDIKVQVENDSILKISGERRREECDECEVKYIRVERQAGKFTRKFNLPTNADVEHISAACQDGLLSVVVPKSRPLELLRPKNFDVKVVA